MLRALGALTPFKGRLAQFEIQSAAFACLHGEKVRGQGSSWEIGLCPCSCTCSFEVGSCRGNVSFNDFRSLE